MMPSTLFNNIATQVDAENRVKAELKAGLTPATPGALDLLLADLKAPNSISVQAAPPAAATEPPSRGGAPQREGLTERAQENLTTLSQPPAVVERMKKGPKELTKEVARSAPEANSEETRLVTAATSLESDIASLQAQIAQATETLSKSLGESKLGLVTTLNTLYELMDKNSRRVIRLKDLIVAVDEKRDIKSANLSPAAKKKAEEITAKIEKKAAEIKELKEEVQALTEEQFSKYGGTETEKRRVTTAPNPDMVASLVAVFGLMGTHPEKASSIRAGVVEMLKTVWERLKSVFSDFDSLDKDVAEYSSLAGA